MNWSWFLITWLYTPLAAGREGFGPGEQDWGYVIVRKKVHMFWWLYYVNPPIKPKNFNVFQKPLLIWLQGGPGVSSTAFGNFEEIGPLDVYLNPRNNTWVNHYNVLFIDQPVGTGFSFTHPEEDYPKNKRITSQNVQDIYHCIREIFIKIKRFKKVPTYILGESYGGRVVVKLAQFWYQRQSLGLIRSNLKGIALGNAWISPIDSVRSWASYLLEMGLIDTVGFVTLQSNVDKIVQAIIKKRWMLAKKLMDSTISVIYTITDNIDIYNVLTETYNEECRNTTDSNEIKGSSDLPLQESQLRRLINGNVTSALGLPKRRWKVFCRAVYNSYIEDFLKPVTNIVEFLLDQTDLKVVVYHGHLDVLIPIHSTLTWMENLRWKFSPEWYNQSRISFKVNGVIQGYVKSYKNLEMYWIIRAGHMVPKDNPSATLAILEAMTAAN